METQFIIFTLENSVTTFCSIASASYRFNITSLERFTLYPIVCTCLAIRTFSFISNRIHFLIIKFITAYLFQSKRLSIFKPSPFVLGILMHELEFNEARIEFVFLDIMLHRFDYRTFRWSLSFQFLTIKFFQRDSFPYTFTFVNKAT